MTHRAQPRIHLGPAARLPPFPIEAFVIEQDRDLVLEWQPTIAPVDEPLAAAVDAVSAASPPPAGSVRVRGRERPWTFLAIVHDFSCDPSCRPAWVADAFAAVLAEAARRAVTTMAAPLLGCVHGRLDPAAVARLLAGALAAAPALSLDAVWLLAGRRDADAASAPLRAAGFEVAID